MIYDDDDRMIEDEDDGYSDVLEDDAEPEPIFNFKIFQGKNKRKASREEYDDEYEEEEYEKPRRGGYEEPRRREESRSSSGRSRSQGYSEPARPVRRQDVKIDSFVPRTFEEVKKVAASLRSGATVLVNLEHASADERRRIMDFMAGVIFATDGQFLHFSTNAYVFAPAGVPMGGIPVESESRSEEETIGSYY